MIQRVSYALRETFANFRRNVILSVAAVITSAVSLLLVGTTFLIQRSFDNLLVQWKGDVGMIVFVRPDGLLTEGSFTSLFVGDGDGPLRTPPLALGLLPGVLRSGLIDSGRAVEANVSPEDLGGQFFVGNALRGLMPAVVAIAKSEALRL